MMKAHAYSNIEKAIAALQKFEGPAEKFELRIANEMLDSEGIAMAIITDQVLAKGWMPNGFQQEPTVAFIDT